MPPFELIRRVIDLTEDVVREAVATREGARQLLEHCAKIAKPNDGAAKIVLLFARMASPDDCDWLDGELRVELVGDGEVTVIEVLSELGGGLRERELPPVPFYVPLAEFVRTFEKVPHLLTPLSMCVIGERRLVLASSSEVSVGEVLAVEIADVHLTGAELPPSRGRMGSQPDGVRGRLPSQPGAPVRARLASAVDPAMPPRSGSSPDAALRPRAGSIGDASVRARPPSQGDFGAPTRRVPPTSPVVPRPESHARVGSPPAADEHALPLVRPSATVRDKSAPTHAVGAQRPLPPPREKMRTIQPHESLLPLVDAHQRPTVPGDVREAAAGAVEGTVEIEEELVLPDGADGDVIDVGGPAGEELDGGWNDL
jgi:hypothetical protein